MRVVTGSIARSLLLACGCAWGLSGCSATPGTVSRSAVRVAEAESEPRAVEAIFRNDPAQLGVEDMALALAIAKLPTNASETDIAAAANQLLGSDRAIAPPFAPVPSVATVDFAAPAGSATLEDVAAIAGALNLPLFARNRDFLAFVSSRILVPRGSLTGTDILALPGLSLPTQQGQTIAFADANLEAAVRDRLNLPSGPILAEDAARIEFLSASDRGVTSLAGIENLVNLRRLFLSNNRLENLAPLAELTHLNELRLFGNNVSDLTPISTLPNLETLDIRSNQILSISALTALPELVQLELGNNPIADFTPLSSLAQLKVLNLRVSNISDLSVLSNLSNLTELDVSFGNLRSFSALSNLSNLEILRLKRPTNLEDLSFLSALTALKELELSENSIRDLTPLAGLTELTEIDLESNAIADITPLSNLANLADINLANNPVSSIDALGNLANLSVVNLAGDRVTNLQPLIDNPGIGAGDTVNVEFNPINTAAIAALSAKGVDVIFTPLPDESFDIDIEFVDNGLTPRLQAQVLEAAARWERAIVRGLPEATFERSSGSCSNGSFPPTDLSRTSANPVDDLFVQVAVAPLGSSAGRGGPCVTRREGLQLPAYGTVRLDTEFVSRAIANNSDIINVATHEIGHVLGIGSNSWARRISGSGSDNPVYVGDGARREYEALGGAGSVPVQINIESHWRGGDLGAELMTPANGSVLSRITLCSLADLGYEVDLSAADEFSLPIPSAAALRSFSPQFSLYDDVDRGPIYFTD